MHIINYIFNAQSFRFMPAIIKTSADCAKLVSIFSGIAVKHETNISLNALILSACKMGTDGLRCNPSGACSFGYGVNMGVSMITETMETENAKARIRVAEKMLISVRNKNSKNMSLLREFGGLYTRPEVQKKLNCTSQWVGRLIAKEVFRTVYSGWPETISKKDVDAYADTERKPGPKPKPEPPRKTLFEQMVSKVGRI